MKFCSRDVFLCDLCDFVRDPASAAGKGSLSQSHKGHKEKRKTKPSWREPGQNSAPLSQSPRLPSLISNATMQRNVRPTIRRSPRAGIARTAREEPAILTARLRGLARRRPFDALPDLAWPPRHSHPATPRLGEEGWPRRPHQQSKKRPDISTRTPFALLSLTKQIY